MRTREKRSRWSVRPKVVVEDERKERSVGPKVVAEDENFERKEWSVGPKIVAEDENYKEDESVEDAEMDGDVADVEMEHGTSNSLSRETREEIADLVHQRFQAAFQELRDSLVKESATAPAREGSEETLLKS